LNLIPIQNKTSTILSSYQKSALNHSRAIHSNHASASIFQSASVFNQHLRVSVALDFMAKVVFAIAHPCASERKEVV
jgi:hypothetical protein